MQIMPRGVIWAKVLIAVETAYNPPRAIEEIGRPMSAVTHWGIGSNTQQGHLLCAWRYGSWEDPRPHPSNPGTMGLPALLAVIGFDPSCLWDLDIVTGGCRVLLVES